MHVEAIPFTICMQSVSLSMRVPAHVWQHSCTEGLHLPQPNFLKLPAGMAAKKRPGGAGGTAALGMLAPADGMIVLAVMLGALAPGAAAGVRGAAAASYWRLLLRGAPSGAPAMFAAVLDAAQATGLAPNQHVRLLPLAP